MALAAPSWAPYSATSVTQAGMSRRRATTRAASSRDYTCASSSKKEKGIRVEDLKVIKEDMVPKLTCGLGVGAGELAADDDLVRPCPVEVATGLVELAEEVADVLLGACVQDPEVWGEFYGGVSIEKSRWSKADQRCSIDREENNDLPQMGAERWRSIGGALTDVLVVGHLS